MTAINNKSIKSVHDYPVFTDYLFDYKLWVIYV